MYPQFILKLPSLKGRYSEKTHRDKEARRRSFRHWTLTLDRKNRGGADTVYLLNRLLPALLLYSLTGFSLTTGFSRSSIVASSSLTTSLTVNRADVILEIRKLFSIISPLFTSKTSLPLPRNKVLVSPFSRKPRNLTSFIKLSRGVGWGGSSA